MINVALIKCEECGKEVSDKAKSCPNCGYPIAEVEGEVKIYFEQSHGQLTRTKCYAYKVNDDGTEDIVGECRQLDTIAIKCKEPFNLKVTINSSFGSPIQRVAPGESYRIKHGLFGKIYFQRVDSIV